MLQLVKALEIMHRVDENGKAVPFSIEFVTADFKRETGGEIIALEKVVILPKKDKPKPATEVNKITRKPNHWDNATRNLLLPNGHRRKVHIRLITKINNQIVIY